MRLNLENAAYGYYASLPLSKETLTFTIKQIDPKWHRKTFFGRTLDSRIASATHMSDESEVK